MQLGNLDNFAVGTEEKALQLDNGASGITNSKKMLRRKFWKIFLNTTLQLIFMMMKFLNC